MFIDHIEQRDGCSISSDVLFTGPRDRIHFGQGTRVNGYTQFRFGAGKINVGQNVLFAQFITVLSHSYNYSDKNRLIREQEMYSRNVVIGDDVWIGSHSVILPGVTIGKGAVIGACSVVTKNVPEYQVWAGVPAKMIKSRK